MRVEPLIGLSDELLVKTLFASPGFVARNEKNGLALRIEGESQAPFPISCAKTQLLHIRVARIVQRVHAWPSQVRPKLLQEAGKGKNLRSDIVLQLVEFRFKLIANFNGPAHPYIMTRNTYAAGNIFASNNPCRFRFGVAEWCCTRGRLAWSDQPGERLPALGGRAQLAGGSGGGKWRNGRPGGYHLENTPPATLQKMLP
jgi:hypothetical protein